MIVQPATFTYSTQNLSYFLKTYSSVLKYLKSICHTIKYLINTFGLCSTYYIIQLENMVIIRMHYT